MCLEDPEEDVPLDSAESRSPKTVVFLCFSVTHLFLPLWVSALLSFILWQNRPTL